ncbi:MAG: lipid-A-disaccharide synthase, partial [Acidobacteria bacterium]|nr:lipid-A-disaccharide synthase [Acidobacteriota bacterium]
MRLKFCISAGEISGDIHGANLARAIVSLSPSAQFFGMGGERMKSAGVKIDLNFEDISVVGVSE